MKVFIDFDSCLPFNFMHLIKYATLWRISRTHKWGSNQSENFQNFIIKSFKPESRPECVCVESNHVTRVIPLTTYSALSNSIIIMTSTFNIPINMKISNIHQNSINNQSSICGITSRTREKIKKDACCKCSCIINNQLLFTERMHFYLCIFNIRNFRSQTGTGVVMRVACSHITWRLMLF